MGFDVIYFVFVYLIGMINWKGCNNMFVVEVGDLGLLYVIGVVEGGYDVIYFDFGMEQDFCFFVCVVRKEGFEVVLDFVLQVLLDYLWVIEYLEWFMIFFDGLIVYVENLLKKYQDIYLLNFDNDLEGIVEEMLCIVQYWVVQGVKIFCVDNLYIKLLQFWEWFICEVGVVDLDVIFFVEVFICLVVMCVFVVVGFQQSYSYFMWCNSKVELEEFLMLVLYEIVDYM